ncbi:MAG: hypothetical protein ACK47B_05735 [Armatimonadota bacterium]
MFRSEYAEAAAQRIMRRVEDIMESARERERHGQSLALDIDARFRLQDEGAVQFQVASAILEESRGLDQDEVVAELLAVGLATVLSGAARAAAEGGISDLDDLPRETSPSPAYLVREKVLN